MAKDKKEDGAVAVMEAPAAPEKLPENRKYRVSRLSGDEPRIVSVKRIPPRIESQKMRVLEVNPETKLQEVVERVVEVAVDVDAEMQADAIRAYNGSKDNYAAKQLFIEALD